MGRNKCIIKALSCSSTNPFPRRTVFEMETLGRYNLGPRGAHGSVIFSSEIWEEEKNSAFFRKPADVSAVGILVIRPS